MATILFNSLNLILWFSLAVYFNHWWLMLFSPLTAMHYFFDFDNDSEDDNQTYYLEDKDNKNNYYKGE